MPAVAACRTCSAPYLRHRATVAPPGYRAYGYCSNPQCSRGLPAKARRRGYEVQPRVPAPQAPQETEPQETEAQETEMQETEPTPQAPSPEPEAETEPHHNGNDNEENTATATVPESATQAPE